MSDDTLSHLRFLTMSQVSDLINYTPAHIYRMMKAGTFPNRVRLGQNRVGWRLSDIEKWVASREVIEAAEPEWDGEGLPPPERIAHQNTRQQPRTQ